MGFRSVPVGGSSWGVFAVGKWRRAGAEGGAGRLRLPSKHRGEQAHNGDLLPSRRNQIGFAVSGPLATAEHRVAAAGQTGEGHDAGGGFGDIGHL